MSERERVNILLVDDQPGKLLTYETILSDLDENLLKAASAREAFQVLLRTEVAVVLVDVCMPDLDGFELAAMIREHPRFRSTAIILVSAVLVDDVNRLQAIFYALQECVRSALGSIRSHRMRSFLTMLGVIIGVASVICIVSLLQGLTRSVMNEFQGIGGNTLQISPLC